MLHVHPPPHLSEQAHELAAHHPDLTGHLFATSGTTGAPKWILHSTAGLNWCARTVNEHFHCTANDTWGLALPEFHVGGFSLTLRAHLAGGSLARFPNRWHATQFHEWLTSQKVTITSLVPTQVFDLVQANLPAPASLRLALIGGEHLDETTFAKALTLGWPLVLSYGMTETAGLIAASAIGEKTLRPLPGWELATDSESRLTIAGPGLFQGHLTEQAFESTRPPFTTKDLVELTENALTLHGRCDDQIKILGELVDLTNLRKQLATALPNHRTTLLPFPEERRGFEIIPVIESATSDELTTCVATWNATLPPFARCQDPVFLTAWPRSPLGKLDLRTLAAQVTDERTSLLRHK